MLVRNKIYITLPGLLWNYKITNLKKILYILLKRYIFSWKTKYKIAINISPPPNLCHAGRTKKETEKKRTLLAIKQEATAEFLKEHWTLEKDKYVISQKRMLHLHGWHHRLHHRTLPTWWIHRKEEMKNAVDNWRKNIKRKLISGKRSDDGIT